MHTSSRHKLVLLVLTAGLSVACSSHMADNGAAATNMTPARAPGGATATPTVPPQFSEVPESDWTLEKPLVGHRLECRDGKIRVFACRDAELLAFLPSSAIGGGDLNDIWGWTDPKTGREFAIVARFAGTSFIEITDPLNPRYLGELPSHAGTKSSEWRDVKVYKHYAFIVADRIGRHGMQVFDLTQLRDVAQAPAVFAETAHYDRINSAHNIVIDTMGGFAYAVGNSGGGETCGGGLHMVDIHDPLHPTFAGCYNESRTGRNGSGRIHDAQCVTYHGPDKEYRGHQLCLGAAETAVSITDVTDKAKPKTISIAPYPNVGFTHQGWFSEDQRYFFLGDEWDEGKGQNTRMMVFDLNDLDDPVLVKEFFGSTPAIDHNLYVKGHYIYQSNYKAGIRLLDVADPRNPVEAAYFDTYPKDDATGYAGSWSNYPYFPSGVVAVSSIGEGVYLIRFKTAASPGS